MQINGVLNIVQSSGNVCENLCSKLCGVAEDPDHGTNGEIAVKIAGMKNNLEDAEES